MVLTLIHQGHHQQLGALADALHLELHKFRATLAQGFGGTQPLRLHQGLDSLTQRRTGDADKAPGLHQPDTGGLMRGLQQARQHLGRHLTAVEVAHIAALGDGPVHGGPLGRAKGMHAHPDSLGQNSAAAATGFDGR